MRQRNEREFVEMCIRKSKQVKGKCNCSLSKQYKIQRSYWRCSQTIWFSGRERKGREEKRKGKEKKKEWGKESISSSVFGYEEKQKGKM